MSEIKHYYLHADLDAFFASVEQLDHPEYRGKPVIVGGKPQDKRSVVSTASYEARVFGVHSAMPTAKAWQLCPQGIFVYGRMQRYSELSYQIMNIFRDYSPDVQQMSIDEAFIDLTGTEKLFGPAEQTAIKIKQRVKQETGLTVSIGLAPTKYLAKLASDMKKPDGFYKIEEGTEQEFMLNLPLKKVWGIGDKTYEALKANGLRTTRDVFEKTPEALNFMFGQNTGSFLYNVVRGIDVVNFDRKAKSHSISNETTFPVDISDIYTAETAILELCHSVIFRLLKEKGFSRTVQVKIRYEDFSTVSIQQTYPSCVLTLDSLYSAAKELFEKKYERGRGIRLIGIALENIETTERTYQQSLFDDGSEKKQNVEKAILTLEKKHPEIKIHKARMLENLGKGIKIIFAATFIMFYGIASSGSLNNVSCQEETAHNNSNWEISGYWQGEMKGSIDSTFGFGNSFGLSAQPPVFDQEVDLSALVHITPQFFFSMEFLDEFKKNTYTIGYDGTNYLKLFRFSNRGITFPQEYSSTQNGYGAGGGQNEAPGIMLNFSDYENNKWSGDFMLRYDMTETKTATFFGKNRVSDSNIKLEKYSDCSMFVIPSAVINNIKNIYIQSESGNHKDNNGIRYVKLSQSDFLILSEQKLLVLSREAVSLVPKDTVPYIVITFFNSTDVNTLLSDTGSYSDETTFAGKIQKLFNSFNENQIELKDYSQLELQSVTCTIDGDNSTGFIIQSPQYFSPYLCANLYKVPDNPSSDFLVTDIYSSSQSPFYKAGRLTFDFDDSVYARIYKSDYEIPDALSPEYRYPFADRYPYLYLKKDTYPLVITERSYTPVKEYDIGKKASAGTVQVFVNGILEPGAAYDSDTGFVKLPSEAGELDKIYITYSEESSDISKGAFVTATGFCYNFFPTLTLDLSFTGRYPFSSEKANASPSDSYKSFSAFTTGLSYKGNNLNAYDYVSTAIEDANTTDILSLESEPLTLDIKPGDKKLTHAIYFNQCDFSQYESINFDFAITTPAQLTLSLESISEEKALEIIIDRELCSELAATNTTWHTISILLKNSVVLIDGKPAEQSHYKLSLNPAVIPQLQKTRITFENDIAQEEHFYLSGIYYKNNSSYFTTKNKTGLKYKNNIWFAEAESVQGISIKTENGDKVSDYINYSAKAGAALFGIKLSADIDSSGSAGHSVLSAKPLLSVVDFGETYRYTFGIAAYEKKNWLKLNFQGINFPLLLQADSYAKNSGIQQTQNYNGSISTDIKGKSSGFYFGSKLSLGQKQDEKLFNQSRYFNTWYSASEYEFSKGEESAQRTSAFNTEIKASIPFAKLVPQLQIDFFNTQKAKKQGLNTSDTFKFTLPFSTTNNAYSLSINHKATLEQNNLNSNYGQDIKTLFVNQIEYNTLYSSIPYYALFDKSLYDSMQQKALQNNITYASQLLEYEFGWRRRLFNNIKDLYIPYSATAGASRNIISTGIKTSDVYQLKGSVTTSFINLFGANSLLNIYNWYKQEEYTGTISAAYKFSPVDTAAQSFVLNTSELMLFYIDNSNTLTLSTEFSIDNNINWSFKSSAAWNRNTQKSLLLLLTKAIWKEAKQMEFNSTVRDSAAISLGRQNRINKQTYEYKRSSEIKYTENVLITSGAGIAFGFEQDKTCRLSLNYKLGIKIIY